MITSELMHITPALAAVFLNNNGGNRPLMEVAVSRLASAMRRGEWKVNGDAIRISDTGRLLDGQHRLSAVLLSGVAIDSLIVRGLPSDVFGTIDLGGKSRTPADVFAIKGEKHVSGLASSSLLLFRYEQCGNPFSTNSATAASFAQLEDVLARHPGLRIAVAAVANSLWVRRHLPPSVAGLCHYLFAKRDAAECDAFFTSLESGAGLPHDSAILHLRNRLSEAKSESKTSITRSYLGALVFKAFRLHLDGASVKTLRIRTNGDCPERDLFVI